MQQDNPKYGGFTAATKSISHKYVLALATLAEVATVAPDTVKAIKHMQPARYYDALLQGQDPDLGALAIGDEGVVVTFAADSDDMEYKERKKKNP